ncbi:MAG: LysR family transcriptional regulator [Alcanivoracaceae bacterium]|nr:LysR family transcriptional regulator [Alcanivoracaceae bacterium]
MRYSLRQLEVFLSAAHFENITRAAESLSMSQSAASSALREFEQQFDIRLFDRVGKRLQLNEFGRQIRSKAEAMMAQAVALEQALTHHEDLGHLKVGATLTIGNYVAVQIMARYMAQQPGARITLDVHNTREVADGVLNFNLDIGLIEGELQHPDLVVTPWRDDELVVFCAPDHPLATRSALSDDDLVNATWISREQGSGTRQTFDRAMYGLLPQLNLALELQHTEAIKRAVEAGLGIGCLSRITLSDAFRRGSLVELPVTHRDLTRQFYFIVHREKFISPGIERWLELCQQS